MMIKKFFKKIYNLFDSYSVYDNFNNDDNEIYDISNNNSHNKFTRNLENLLKDSVMGENNTNTNITTIYDKLDASDEYPISKFKAFKIANENPNLRADFCRNDERKISYLSFKDCEIKLKNYNNDSYWHIQITKGDISWIEYEDDFYDGVLDADDCKKLQCLVNVNTGEYLYFSNL